MSGDAHHISAPSDDGDGPYRVMRNALRDASMEPAEVGYINAHGTSTPHGDRIETIAIKRLFGEAAREVPISSTKSMSGHHRGAAGSYEAGALVGTGLYVRAVLGGGDGGIPYCVYRLQGDTRIAQVRSYRLEHGGSGYVYLGFHDLTELYYLNTVFDGIRDPLLVLGADWLLSRLRRPRTISRKDTVDGRTTQMATQALFKTGRLIGAALGHAPKLAVNAAAGFQPHKPLFNLAYGPQPRQRLDVYVPRRDDGPFPVILYLYGGSWSSGAKEIYRFLGADLAARGFLGYSLNRQLAIEAALLGIAASSDSKAVMSPMACSMLRSLTASKGEVVRRRIRTCQSCLSRPSAKFAPRKPVPPVISARMNNLIEATLQSHPSPSRLLRPARDDVIRNSIFECVSASQVCAQLISSQPISSVPRFSACAERADLFRSRRSASTTYATAALNCQNAYSDRRAIG